MSTILAKLKRLYDTAEASLSIAAKQWAYGSDTRRIVVMESDGTTKRYFYDSTRMADQSGTYGSALIGTPAITGVTPDGGSLSAAATLKAMLTGLKNYSDTALATSIGGTVGNILKKTGAGAAGDSILLEALGYIIQYYSNNGPTLHSVQNPSGGTSAISGLQFTGDGSLAGVLFTGSTGYTDEAYAANRVNLAASASAAGINLVARNSTGTIRSFFGTTMGSGTLFHTLSNKGIRLENLVLSTDADGQVAGLDVALSLTKNDSNTRQFYGGRVLATLNSGGSNANTTLDALLIDTINTSVTGMTVNLLNLKYGGASKARINSSGDLFLATLNNHYLPVQLSGKLDSSLMYYDDTNIRLGIGITPQTSLHLTQGADSIAAISIGSSTAGPSSPSANDTARFYVKADKAIIQYRDGGTTKYWYLDLTSTSGTWTYTTVAP